MSRKENLAECYEPNASGEYGERMRIRADALKRDGYRLPTEAEWEYACRAGATTSRYYGQSVDLLGDYARYAGNSQDHAWMCGSALPNDLGLFDMLGNVYEWCQDGFARYQSGRMGVISDNVNTSIDIDVSISRLRRGGPYANQPDGVRSAFRGEGPPAFGGTEDGFRLARTYNRIY